MPCHASMRAGSYQLSILLLPLPPRRYYNAHHMPYRTSFCRISSSFCSTLSLSFISVVPWLAACEIGRWGHGGAEGQRIAVGWMGRGSLRGGVSGHRTSRCTQHGNLSWV